LTPSDARFKYNIRKDVPGLDFITRLNPVTYNFDDQKLSEYTRTGILESSYFKKAAYTGEKIRHTGFLAQDVEKIAKELGYDFDGIHTPSNNKDHYGLAYSQFIMPLVKAVQEQQEEINNLRKENEELKKLKVQVENLIKTVQALSTNKQIN
jgi:trimeric autotransporter adhesin